MASTTSDMTLVAMAAMVPRSVASTPIGSDARNSSLFARLSTTACATSIGVTGATPTVT